MEQVEERAGDRARRVARPSLDRAPYLEIAVIKGLTYAVVTTDDVPRARRFFTEKLGLSMEEDEGDTFSQFTTRDGTLWAVMQAPPETPEHGVALYGPDQSKRRSSTRRSRRSRDELRVASCELRVGRSPLAARNSLLRS